MGARCLAKFVKAVHGMGWHTWEASGRRCFLGVGARWAWYLRRLEAID